MRPRFRFSHRGGDRYYWVAVQTLPGDSRTEHVNCPVDWFWAGGDMKARKVPARVAATQERKRSNAAGAHSHSRPRSEQERKALKDQES